MTIPIGIIGRILNPEVKEPFIMVENDLSNTGGYYIYTCNIPAFGPPDDRFAITGPDSWLPENEIDPASVRGFDSWVLEDELEGFFLHVGWDIEWADSSRCLPD